VPQQQKPPRVIRAHATSLTQQDRAVHLKAGRRMTAVRRPDTGCRRERNKETRLGGVTTASQHALIWQWSGGGGVSNGAGDFDQIGASIVR